MNNKEMIEKKPSRFLTLFADMVSYVFHPMFMPGVMTIVLFKLTPQAFAGFNVIDFGRRPLPLLAPILINTVFFPLLAVLLMKGLGFVESIKLENPKDRIIPLIATMTFYFWIYLTMSNTNAPFLLKVLLLGSFWSVIAIFMINIFFKISMHTAGAGGAIAMIVALMLYSPVNMVLPLFITIVVAGIIGTARLILSAHSPSQVWLGYIVGFIVQLAAYWYLK
jgi:hypothetical protein